MGSSYSTEPASPADGTLRNVVNQEYGFRVHRVEAGSPGQAAGLQSIVDYIVVANGVRLDHDDGSFVRMIAESKGKPMRLCVFDTHTLRTRETVLTPDDTWGGSGLLGITIRFDIAQPLSKHTLHVLEVFPDSPASAAGLDSFNDCACPRQPSLAPCGVLRRDAATPSARAPFSALDSPPTLPLICVRACLGRRAWRRRPTL